jgi:26S proteasome regulatory subunit N3
VHSKEQRFILRVLRSLPNTRRRLNGNVLRKLISGYYTHSTQEKDALLAFVEEVRIINVKSE